jgi:hypothetical protein
MQKGRTMRDAYYDANEKLINQAWQEHYEKEERMSEVSIKDMILIKALLEGSFDNEDNSAKLTVKGFVGANITAARVALQTLQRPILENDIKEIIKFLKEAETALDMLKDSEE